MGEQFGQFRLIACAEQDQPVQRAGNRRPVDLEFRDGLSIVAGPANDIRAAAFGVPEDGVRRWFLA